MAHPGIAFVAVVGIGIGLALLYLLSGSPQPQPQRPHYSDPRPPPDPSSSSSYRNTSAGTSNNSTRRRGKRRGVNKDESCSICLEALTMHKQEQLGCGHVYHTICIQEWKTVSNNYATCPICRDQI